jgi:hypothetical protein
MIRSGIGAAMSSTTSRTPPCCCAVRRAVASTSSTTSCTESVSRSSTRGVKLFDTIRRIFACRGSSMLIIEP